MTGEIGMGQFSSEQLSAIKAFIIADPVLSTKISGPGTDYAFVADALNATSAPNFWCRKNPLYKSEVVSQVSVDGTSFIWPAFIARSQGERDGWRELWSCGNAGGTSECVDAGKPNIQQAFADIFSGSANSAPAQRTHMLAISRRLATVAERLLATGTGSTGSPAVFGWQGSVTIQDVGEIVA
jgi:hypothetical protein